MRSLRARLVFAMLLVAVIAVAGVAALSRLAVRVEYRRLVTPAGGDRLPDVAAGLRGRITPGLSRAGMDALLAERADPLGLRLLLLASDGRVLGASAPSLGGVSARMEATRLVLETQEGGRTRQMILMGPPRAEITAADGRPIGTLFALPPESADAEPPFLASVNRWLLLAAAAAVALALGLALALSRRIVGPVTAMTAAARRMEEGDLGARVPAA